MGKYALQSKVNLVVSKGGKWRKFKSGDDHGTLCRYRLPPQYWPLFNYSAWFQLHPNHHFAPILLRIDPNKNSQTFAFPRKQRSLPMWGRDTCIYKIHVNIVYMLIQYALSLETRWQSWHPISLLKKYVFDFNEIHSRKLTMNVFSRSWELGRVLNKKHINILIGEHLTFSEHVNGVQGKLIFHAQPEQVSFAFQAFQGPFWESSQFCINCVVSQPQN